MITMKEFLEAIDYRITEGSPYCWNSFGPDARWLDGTSDHYSASIIFDSKTQEVYRAEVCDNINDRAYRLTNPAYAEAVKQEAKERGVDDLLAWDEVKWTELETAEDWIEKATAIRDGQEYDTRVSIPLDLPDDMIFQLMCQAHEQDITFNQLMEQVLRKAIDHAMLEHGIVKA